MHLVTSSHGAGVGGGGVSGIRRSVLGFGVVGTVRNKKVGVTQKLEARPGKEYSALVHMPKTHSQARAFFAV